MTATAEAPVDMTGRCGWCGCPQFNHRLGKKGCKDPECGCAKYEPPKGAPAADPGLAAALAEPEPVDEPEPDPGPVVADPAVQAEHVEQVAAIDAQLADPARPSLAASVAHAHTLGMACPAAGCRWPTEGPESTDDEIADEIDRAEDAAEIERLTAELATARREANEALNRAGHYRAKRDDERRRADRLDAALRDATAELEQVRSDKVRLAGQLAPRLADLDQALGEVSKLRHVNVELGRARAEIDRLRRERDKARDALTDAIRTGTAAATNVLYRYDADQCTTEGCGSRYTVPVEHPHPLTPVTVLIVRREVPGA